MTSPRPLWRVAFDAPEAVVDDLVERLDELALSVSAFEADGDGTDRAPTWRIELLLDAEPDTGQIARTVAEAGLAGADLTVDAVPETDWLTATARQFPPVRAGRFVVHGSHARDQLPGDAIPVEIDAGLAFGSGEHATTQGCLMAMSRIVRRRHRILDLGCGSAVLAIAAARLWPTARVLAADNDSVAVRVAAANVRINDVASHVRTLVSEGYAASAIRHAAPFDLILANILADPLIELAPALARHLAPGGHAVLSGLLDRQAEAVAVAHTRRGLRLVHRRDIGPWTTLLLRGRL
ncbi:MAG TPA: 50S ribosomal protein L11 methyltransferase [Geminicoccaceae bacterium]|nr:50S ribosomal protein L11 methyltransferase [Geminicoccus sp.]HMU52793.1 50S ribosomal protein L11 methyltransferase [Geminicoccaceae bacterium]